MTPNLKALARRVGGVVVMLLALGPAVIMAAPAAQASTANAGTIANYEHRVINLINIQRLRYGLGRLTQTACPDGYAKGWAAYLANTGYFYHRSMMEFLDGCRVQRVAENIARGDVSPDVIVNAWMASPGHRANILDARLNRIGVGAVYAHGTWTVDTDFSRPY
jgi:uncharacterized protein YkwD